jgi:hypothetical protein
MGMPTVILHPASVYPHSGTCGYCGRDRDDLFWHAEDETYYCAHVWRCEQRRYVLERRVISAGLGPR